jgi:general L-amino acid transport system substrate-binding protein
MRRLVIDSSAGRIRASAVAALVAWLALHAAPAAADTLHDVRRAGVLRCGVTQGYPGISAPDDKGVWHGIDVDYCRALAAAILGSNARVRFVPLSAKVRFTALQSGAVDILSRYTSWTFTRDTRLGINFAGILYHDGQGFMVRRSLGVTSARQLSGASVCTTTGTTTERNLADYFRSHGMTLRVVAFENSNEALAAYQAGRCDVYTTSRMALAGQRTKLRDPAAHVVLPETISDEPAGPVVRQGDDRFWKIARWVLNALVVAEEKGVTSANVDAVMRSTTDPETRRLLGVDGDFGRYLGLDRHWAANAIRAVGNYAQIFRRNIAPLGLSRGVNRLWSRGGLLYAPPFR